MSEEIQRKDCPCNCPANKNAGMAYQRAHQPHWEDDRWTPGESIPSVTHTGPGGERIVDQWMVAWKEEWGTPPRTCSYCGAVCPADAFELLARGWEIELCDNRGKAYIHPPGYKENFERLLVSIGTNDYVSDYHSPVPPVKFRSYHATEEELQRFNHYLRNQYK